MSSLRNGIVGLRRDEPNDADLEAMDKYHTPVLLNEAVDALQLQPGHVIIDGTIGGGGHAREILTRISPQGVLIGFDQDRDAIEHVRATLGQDYDQEHLILIHDNFINLPIYERQFRPYSTVNGVLLDLGVSFHQIRAEGRGFSFQKPEEPLDMRMDERSSTTAQHLINSLSQPDLTQLLRDYGEEPNAQRIAHYIVEQRKQKPLQTTGDLLECIYQGYAGKSKPASHIATRTFQALRIAVNKELEYLPTMLAQAITTLSPGGIFAVITFHSLEDRIVKRFFKKASLDCICPLEFPECRCEHRATIRRITKRPIRPSESEVQFNPKSRSALLRVIEKI